MQVAGPARCLVKYAHNRYVACRQWRQVLLAAQIRATLARSAAIAAAGSAFDPAKSATLPSNAATPLSTHSAPPAEWQPATLAWSVATQVAALAHGSANRARRTSVAKTRRTRLSLLDGHASDSRFVHWAGIRSYRGGIRSALPDSLARSVPVRNYVIALFGSGLTRFASAHI